MADERMRYARQLILPEVGAEGQRRLRNASVAVVGAGGLGSPVAMYLAAAGIGKITIVDFDLVDAGNLHRQLLHRTSDVGRRKVDSARDAIQAINPYVEVDRHPVPLTRENAFGILCGHDVIADGTDNFPARYLVNDACVLLGIPNASGSIHRFDGQLSVYAHADGPCYRCLFREPPPPGLVPSCAEAGVIGAVAGIVGTLQAMECIKLILGVGEPLVGRLLVVESLPMRFRTLDIARDPECPACGTRELRSLIDYDAFCGAGAPAASRATVEPAELAAVLRDGNPSSIALLDVREASEWAEDRLPGAELLPLGRIAEAAGRIGAGREVVVYCRSGARSERAARRLTELGFTRVRSLSGGLLRYRLEGHP